MDYIIFTIDCIASKKIEQVSKLIEDKMEQLNKDSLRNQDFVTPFVVLKGDEIQGVVSLNRHFLKVIRYLREACFPINIRIGIGVGAIDTELTTTFDNPWTLNGQAFHFAREALEYLSSHKMYSRKPMSHIVLENKELEVILNAQLILYDTILAKWTKKTYEAVYLKEKYGSFQGIGGHSNVTGNAMKHRAARGDWTVLDDFEKMSAQIMDSYL